MTLRLMMGPGIFRVSKPGFNADSSLSSHILFSEQITGLVPGVIGEISLPSRGPPPSSGAWAIPTAYIANPDAGNIPLFFYKNVVGLGTIVITPDKSSIMIQNSNQSSGLYIRYYAFKTRSM